MRTKQKLAGRDCSSGSTAQSVMGIHFACTTAKLSSQHPCPVAYSAITLFLEESNASFLCRHCTDV